ncbi:4a-hydroxytetrahydrobiopterin dehydratase [Citricoccus sp. GCM10030269]|uniref:4a-hydroxytetrahydrobiopterin dehydratase n=1 Tax=Citricoccus sp. GCM10030269 TaxID=3273388 RepID=UPI003612970D
MSDPKQKLTSTEIADAGLTDWQEADGTLRAEFRTKKFATGLDLVNRIGNSAEEANHHPDLTLTYPSVSVTLSSHDVGGITSRDLDLARIISDHAAALGVEAASEK